MRHFPPALLATVMAALLAGAVIVVVGGFAQALGG